MINSSFEGVSSPIYGNLPQTVQSESQYKLSHLLVWINCITRIAQEVLVKTACGLLDLSFKVVGLAFTGINFTAMKVREFTVYISQINWSIIHIGPQITIQHHVVNHYNKCSHCSYQERDNEQPFQVAAC